MRLTEAEKEKRRQYYRDNKQLFIDKARKWKAQNPEKAKESSRKSVARSRTLQAKEEKKNSYLQYTYGISLSQYTEMYNKQHGSCNICLTPLAYQNIEGSGHKTANVDHNHTTGKVRGLLCNKCNRGLGYLQDNATLLRRAAEYLDATNG